MADSWETKWADGQAKLRRATCDEDARDALNYLHGALEDYLRHELGRDARTPAELRERATHWDLADMLEVVSAMEEIGRISSSQASAIRTANRYRNKIAHGNRVSITRAYVQEYGELVGQLLGIEEALRRNRAQERTRALERATRCESEAGQRIAESHRRLEELERLRRAEPWRVCGFVLLGTVVLTLCPMSLVGGAVTVVVGIVAAMWGVSLDVQVSAWTFIATSIVGGLLASLVIVFRDRDWSRRDDIAHVRSTIRNDVVELKRAAARVDSLTGEAADSDEPAPNSDGESPTIGRPSDADTSHVITASILSRVAQREREIWVVVAVVLVFVVLPLCLIAVMAASR